MIVYEQELNAINETVLEPAASVQIDIGTRFMNSTGRSRKGLFRIILYRDSWEDVPVLMMNILYHHRGGSKLEGGASCDAEIIGGSRGVKTGIF